jgi:type IV pilus assembly protein PilM
MGFFGKKTYVGLDLGHSHIKAVQLERNPLGWKVVRSGQVPTPPMSIKDGVVVDQESVAFAIRDLLRETGIHVSCANIAVAGASVVVRPVRMPKMPEATLRKSIKFEASRYVPSSVEDSFIEFEIVGPVDETQMDVMVVAAPKDIVQSRLLTCEAAGLDVESVDVEVFAMHRALIEADQDHDWSQSTLALVDIGSATTNVSVVQRGTFAMNRSIPNGGQNLTDALKNYFKLSEEDAEAGKAQLNLMELVDEQPKENPPLRVLQPHVDDLVREVRRSLNYFQSQQSEGAQSKEVHQIVLTGGGAKMPGLAAYFEHKLQLPARAIGVFDNPRFSHAHALDDTGLDLAVASGLAMRAFTKAA